MRCIVPSFPLTAAVCALACLATAPVQAQQIQGLPPGMTTEEALRYLRQNPQLREMVRQRIVGSGLSQQDIRQRLATEGVPPELLDSYLLGEPTAGVTMDSQMLQAISLLGVNAIQPTDFAPLDSAASRLWRDAVRADSIRAEEGAVRDLELFGLETFRQPTMRFRPVVTGPVEGSYVLGPGDVLVLILTGAVQASEVLEVTSAGFVVIPNVGQIYVNTLTLDQFRDVLYDRLRRAYSSVSRSPDARTRFTLSVARVKSQMIRVLGEVARPNAYVIAATGGALSALYEAGGLTTRGSFRRVEVRRGSQLLGTVDLYDYLVRGETDTGISLAAGDVVFVPVRGARVKIVGAVTRPAIYELKEGEGLAELLTYAGGLTPEAATHAATVFHVLPPGERTEPGRFRTVLTEPLAPILAGATTGAPLSGGDSVVVYAAAGGQRNSVTIAGGVWQPGTYQVEPGMRVSELLRVAGGLRPEAYSERAAIIRTHPDSTRELLAVALSPAGIPEASRDVELLEGDQVTVFTRIESRPERYVDVSGAVGRPGRIMYADSMTVRDAVLLAGGATEDAYLLEAEVSRMRGGGSTDDTLAVVLRVPLDTSVVLDPTSPLPAPSGTGSGADVTLRPYDNVFVRHRPGWERPENVAIAGEVRFPGRYTILTRNERLSNLLERAGGLTPVAYANGIRFIRAEDDAGRVAVDLERVLTDPSHPHNLILEAGDSVFIPRFIPIVRVQGAVNSQASVTYLRGAGLDYYINSAGGFAARADKGRTFVLQPNGLIERRGRPEPGAVVTVPEKDPSQRSWLIELAPFLTGLVSLMTAAATLIIAIGP